MPEYLAQLRCRLTELGCPAGRLNRMVQEIADHREDLMEAAAREGAAAPEASAETVLGQPRALGDQLMASYRQSTWCGRHFLAVFGFLPLLFPLFWAVCLGLELLLYYGLEWGWDPQKLKAASENPFVLGHWTTLVYVASETAFALAALIFCWLARRSGVSLLWMIIACWICSYYGLFLTIGIAPHQLFLGFYSAPQWGQGAIPLVIAAVACLRYRRRVQAARSVLA